MINQYIKSYSRYIIAAFFFAPHFLTVPTTAQVDIEPPDYNATSDITVHFDASGGNKALENYTGDVYMHTGIVQGTALSPTGWGYVQGNWGQPDEKVKLKRLSPNKFSISLNISRFYNIDPNEKILQMAFVFRDAEGKIVAKTKDGKDIYFPELEILEHGKIEKIKNAEGEGFGPIKSIKKSDDGKYIIIQGGKQSMTISLKEKGILNFRYYPTGKIEERASYADILDSAIELDYTESINNFQIQVEENHILKVSKSNLIIELEKNGVDVFSIKDSPQFMESFEGAGPFSFLKMDLKDDEHVYGLGSRALRNDRVGQRLYVYNKPNYNYQYGEDDVYLSLPYFLSSKGYGLLLDSPRKSVFDFGKEDPTTIEIGAKEDHLSFYILYGDNPLEISKKYIRLTGAQGLPPLWAMGYFQSRYGYKSQSEINAIVDQTIKEGFPLDATVLDLFWFGGTSRMGDFDWDRDSFPDPDALINEFDKKGVKTILITESYVVDSTDFFDELDSLAYFAKDDKGESFVINSFWCGPAALIDVFAPGVSNWLWKIYKREYERGAAAWWCDSGEPENHPLEMNHVNGTAEEIHNLYALQWAKIFHDNFNSDYPDKRLFNMTRSGYPGMQRYNTIPWSGDVSRTWSALRAQPSIMMGTGISGVPYIHHDIGGFTGTEKDEELYVRWIQLGTFSPVMRVHGDGQMLPPEPIFYSENTKNIVREYIKLRYHLLPYNYKLAKEASEEGSPFVRPMFYHYSNDEVADTINEQFLWGKDILVAPILNKSQKSKRVYLAKDNWYDFYSNELIKNKLWTEVPTQLEQIPIYIKAGSFIPMVNKELQNTTEYTGENLKIKYYYDSLSSESSFLIDDGITNEGSENYQSESWTCSKEEKGNWYIFTIETSDKPIYTKEKNWEFEFLGLHKESKCIKIDGKKVKKNNTYSYDQVSKSLTIKFPFNSQNLEIRVKK
jgi:oligosaccharide 4-alpha-D-glucosyltransferase